jgi:hypothetical protein
MKHILTLSAILALTPIPALADDWTITGTGKVSNTSITFNDYQSGKRGFIIQGVKGYSVFYGDKVGMGYIGRFKSSAEDKDHPAFYRVETGTLILLDTGMVCSEPGTPDAVCQ